MYIQVSDYLYNDTSPPAGQPSLEFIWRRPIGVNAAVVHYDKDVFGRNTDQFNPDRRIYGDAVQMNKAMIPFGADWVADLYWEECELNVP